jgi:multisubunit Na+/H+ antiporter MnhB subunit
VILILLVYGLIKAKFHYLPESIACVLLGAVVGLLLKVLPIGDWKVRFTFCLIQKSSMCALIVNVIIIHVHGFFFFVNGPLN